MELHCPFCELPEGRIFQSNKTAFAIRDAYPISDGHTLLIPKRHIKSWFDTTDTERYDLFELLSLAKNKLANEFNPDGFNIGINDGPAAGQTVPHLHIHLIPRFQNGQEDPRGGVRWVIPSKAKYW
jgi:diadenosine tetraphosphate (Ap4A) HIT family hydrolase